MRDIALSIAIADYDRTRPLLDGRIKIDGVEPSFVRAPLPEIYYRAMTSAPFDICELSLAGLATKAAEADFAYVGLPIFPLRGFRHSSICIRTDRIKQPHDLLGCRIGLPEYELTPMVWLRALLMDQYGIRPSDVVWVRGGIDHPHRSQSTMGFPPGVTVIDAKEGVTLRELLLSGEIDAYISPRPLASTGNAANIGLLFPDPVQAANEYFKTTGIFPILHILCLKKQLYEAHPALPDAICRSFENARRHALGELTQLLGTITLPLLEDHALMTDRQFGDDPWTYGLDERNRLTLEIFLRHHYDQGLGSRPIAVDKLIPFAA